MMVVSVGDGVGLLVGWATTLVAVLMAVLVGCGVGLSVDCTAMRVEVLLAVGEGEGVGLVAWVGLIVSVGGGVRLLVGCTVAVAGCEVGVWVGGFAVEVASGPPPHGPKLSDFTFVG